MRISIHAPHAGSGIDKVRVKADGELFQSTLPMRGAAEVGLSNENGIAISIHAPHAGSGSCTSASLCRLLISIHAPHAGSGIKKLGNKIPKVLISIHAPHAGSGLAYRA